MPTLVVPASVAVCQIDDFPEEVATEDEKGRKGKPRPFKRMPRGKRKVEGGALHVRPASTLVVTDDELGHIKTKHKKLFEQLIVHEPGFTLDGAVKRLPKEKRAKVETAMKGRQPRQRGTTAPKDRPKTARRSGRGSDSAAPSTAEEPRGDE